MRSGVGDNNDWQNLLAAQGITTGIMVRFDFLSGTVCAWTGPYSLTVSGTGDPLCDGQTFEPISQGVMIDIGANQFNYAGSESLPLSLAIPDPPTDAMIGAVGDNSEWQGRTCILWRVVMLTPPSATMPAQYVARRVRAGAMDELRVTNDGVAHRFVMSIEGHASMISNATQGTYLDQKKFDPNDTSQDWAVAIVNDPRTPRRAPNGGGFGGGGGGGGVGGGGLLGCVVVETHLPTGLAGDVAVGDHLVLGNPATFKEREGLVSYSERKPVECVRVTTATGIELECSTSAPIGIEGGGSVLAPDVLGCRVPVRDRGRWAVDVVTSVQPIGVRDVQHITCENDFFLAGKEPDRFLLHHNMKVLDSIRNIFD